MQKKFFQNFHPDCLLIRLGGLRIVVDFAADCGGLRRILWRIAADFWEQRKHSSLQERQLLVRISIQSRKHRPYNKRPKAPRRARGAQPRQSFFIEMFFFLTAKEFLRSAPICQVPAISCASLASHFRHKMYLCHSLEFFDHRLLWEISIEQSQGNHVLLTLW